MRTKTLDKKTNHALNRRIFDLRAQGYSYSMIQAALVTEGIVKSIALSTISVKLNSARLKEYYYGQ